MVIKVLFIPIFDNLAYCFLIFIANNHFQNKPRDLHPKLVPIPPSPEVIFAAKRVPKLILKAWSVFQLARRFIGKGLHEFPRSNYDQKRFKLPDQDPSLLYHTILSVSSLDAATTDRIVKKAKETNCTVSTINLLCNQSRIEFTKLRRGRNLTRVTPANNFLKSRWLYVICLR